MSDQPQGPGWWQASDGKWYPPQQPPAAPEPLGLPVVTSDVIPGRDTVRYVGLAVGVITRSMGFAKGFTGSFKALTRGEVTEYTETLAEARHGATVRMVEQAVAMGANAVVAMRYDSGDIGEQGGLAEIVAYGTAVVID